MCICRLSLCRVPCAPGIGIFLVKQLSDNRLAFGERLSAAISKSALDLLPLKNWYAEKTCHTVVPWPAELGTYILLLHTVTVNVVILLATTNAGCDGNKNSQDLLSKGGKANRPKHRIHNLNAISKRNKGVTEELFTPCDLFFGRSRSFCGIYLQPHVLDMRCSHFYHTKKYLEDDFPKNRKGFSDMAFSRSTSIPGPESRGRRGLSGYRISNGRAELQNRNNSDNATFRY